MTGYSFIALSMPLAAPPSFGAQTFGFMAGIFAGAAGKATLFEIVQGNALFEACSVAAGFEACSTAMGFEGGSVANAFEACSTATLFEEDC